MKNGRLLEKRLTRNYILIDAFTALTAWICFFTYRKFTEYCDLFSQVWNIILYDYKFYVGSVLVSICWILLYAVYGTYRDVAGKSRIKEFFDTFTIVLPGVVVVFFAVILDDAIAYYTDYMRLFGVLFLFQFAFTAIGRMLFIARLRYNIRREKIWFNTLLIGTKEAVAKLVPLLNKPKSKFGHKIVGYVSIEGDEADPSNHAILPCLGNYEQIDKIIEKHEVKEVIIAGDPFTRSLTSKIIPLLIQQHILLKVMPVKEELLLGMVKNTAVFTEPMMQVYLDLLPLWQKIFKRAMDISISALFIIIFSPLYVFLAIGVKLSSKGSVFFKQQRIGKGGKPFRIIKFRSMCQNAEPDGKPRLASMGDDRITRFGLFMRRTHLDEIPQFFLVFKGDMSLVGPRPERQYYIDQIVEQMPYYKLLLMVKPGITSWGQVTYGYAENVEQMLERLPYDIMYIENMSVMMDIKIMFYTLVAVLRRNGK